MCIRDSHWAVRRGGRCWRCCCSGPGRRDRLVEALYGERALEDGVHALHAQVSGMGTGLAVVSAYVLAGELAAAPVHRTAFEREVRGYAEGCGRSAEGVAGFMVPRSRFMAWFVNQKPAAALPAVEGPDGEVGQEDRLRHRAQGLHGLRGHWPRRASSSSTTFGSSFLNSGTGGASGVPGLIGRCSQRAAPSYSPVITG